MTVNALVLAATLGEAVNIEPPAREIAAVGPATGRVTGYVDGKRYAGDTASWKPAGWSSSMSARPSQRRVMRSG